MIPITLTSKNMRVYIDTNTVIVYFHYDCYRKKKKRRADIFIVLEIIDENQYNSLIN